MTSLNYRFATLDDCSLLAALNMQLLQDENHRNRRTTDVLETRMRNWLATSPNTASAVLFEQNQKIVAYALYQEYPEYTYLRQFFVVRDYRRQGIGTAAIELLRAHVWPPDRRLTVEVLINNTRGIMFWRSVGYQDYLLGLEIAPLAYGNAE